MPFLLAEDTARPRLLVINPNSTEVFSRSMQGAIRQDIPIDFYTPNDAPPAIEGTVDSILSAAVVLQDLKDRLDEWDGFIVACFSAHPLVPALRELTLAPAVGILDTPILYASQISSSIGILTTSPGWVPLLQHDLHTFRLSATVVSSGISVLDLERLPREKVMKTLCTVAKEKLKGVGAIVLGCAGMVGLKEEVEKACDGVRVIDPVEAGVEMCKSLVRMRLCNAC